MNSLDRFPHQFDAVKAQYDHYLALLELFETRQTWTFNFAIVVYAAALASFSPLFEKAVIPAIKAGTWTSEGDLAVSACVILYSIVFPLIMLPLCYLYIDVSVFCASMNAGTLPQFVRRFKDFGGLDNGDPGLLAIEWLDSQRDQGINLDIQHVANSRTLVFLLAPLFGVIVGGCGTGLWVTSHVYWGVGVLSAAGAIISTAIFYLSLQSCRKSHRARKLSRTARLLAIRN